MCVNVYNKEKLKKSGFVPPNLNFICCQLSPLAVVSVSVTSWHNTYRSESLNYMFHHVTRKRLLYGEFSPSFNGAPPEKDMSRPGLSPLKRAIKTAYCCLLGIATVIYYTIFHLQDLFKHLRSTRIDSKEPIPPGCVSWRVLFFSPSFKLYVPNWFTCALLVLHCPAGLIYSVL